MAPSEASRQETNLIVSYRATTVASVAANLAVLATLVVVVSIKDIDALSTVALALAVIAFVAQLIVFVVQTSAANAQMLQTQELYGSMQGVLAELSEKAAGTQSVVSTMNERVIEALMGKRIAERGGSDRPDADNVTALAQDVSSALASSAPQYLRRHVKPGDAETEARLRTFPSEAEAVASMDKLSQLDPLDAARLQNFANDMASNLRDDSFYDPGLIVSAPDSLLADGLVSEIPGSEQTVGHALGTLTPHGVELARLLLAQGDPPAAIADRLAEVKSAIEQTTQRLVYGRPSAPA